MSTTMEAIGDRVSPGRVVERRWNRVRSSASGLSGRVMGAPRQALDSVGSSGSGTGPDTGGSGIGDAASSVADQVRGAPDRIQHGTEGNPLAAGAVAFGLGLLVGSMAPPAREETRLAEQLLEPVQHELQDMGREVATVAQDRAKEGAQQTAEVASDAADQVRGEAQGAAQEVKGEATDRAGQVADEAKGNAEQVRGQGGPSAP